MTMKQPEDDTILTKEEFLALLEYELEQFKKYLGDIPESMTASAWYFKFRYFDAFEKIE